MHDQNVTDGAVRLYAHMHWRYGRNQKNWEGRRSMADELGVKPRTITSRIKELSDANWVVAIPRDGDTNFYHIFEDQDECKRWREEHPGKNLPGGMAKNCQGVWQKSATNPDSSDSDSVNDRKSASSTPPSLPRARNSNEKRANQSSSHEKIDEEDNDIRRGEDSDQKKSVSPLELFLQKTAHGWKVSKGRREKLGLPITTFQGNLASPIELYDADPDFKAWIEDQVIPVIQGKGHETDADFLAHLVNRICVADDGKYGGFTHYKQQAVQERAEQKALADAKANEYHEIDHVKGVKVDPKPSGGQPASLDDLLKEMENDGW